MQKLTIVLSLLAIIFYGCPSTNNCLPVTTDPDANKTQFLGVWYEIASFNQFFNIGCRCTQAEYIDNGTEIIVKNSCIQGTNLVPINNRITGTAFAPNPSDFSKLKVQFPVAPTAADYWILEFDTNGQYMMVGSPDKNSLFILSRTRSIDPGIYSTLLQRAEAMCFDIDKLNGINQNNCTGI